MQVGDTVRVRATARRAQIIEDLGQSRYRVLFYAELGTLYRRAVSDCRPA